MKEYVYKQLKMHGVNEKWIPLSAKEASNQTFSTNTLRKV